MLTSLPSLPKPPVRMTLPLTRAALAPSSGLGNSGPSVQWEAPGGRNSVEEKEPWKPGFPPAATSTWIEGQSFYIYMCRRSNLRFLRSDLQSLSRPRPIVLHSIRAILPKNPLCLYTWDGNCDCIQQEQQKKQNSNFPVGVLRTLK